MLGRVATCCLVCVLLLQIGKILNVFLVVVSPTLVATTLRLCLTTIRNNWHARVAGSTAAIRSFWTRPEGRGTRSTLEESAKTDEAQKMRHRAWGPAWAPAPAPAPMSAHKAHMPYMPYMSPATNTASPYSTSSSSASTGTALLQNPSASCLLRFIAFCHCFWPLHTQAYSQLCKRFWKRSSDSAQTSPISHTSCVCDVCSLICISIL